MDQHTSAGPLILERVQTTLDLGGRGDSVLPSIWTPWGSTYFGGVHNLLCSQPLQSGSTP